MWPNSDITTSLTVFALGSFLHLIIYWERSMKTQLCTTKHCSWCIHIIAIRFSLAFFCLPCEKKCSSR